MQLLDREGRESKHQCGFSLRKFCVIVRASSKDKENVEVNSSNTICETDGETDIWCGNFHNQTCGIPNGKSEEPTTKQTQNIAQFVSPKCQTTHEPDVLIVPQPTANSDFSVQGGCLQASMFSKHQLCFYFPCQTLVLPPKPGSRKTWHEECQSFNAR